MSYVRTSGPGEYASEWIEHLDGVEWWLANPPRRWHRCWPQSRAWMRGELVERCACGGLRFDGTRPWINRNTSSAPTAEERARHERLRVWDALVDEYESASPGRQAEIRDTLRAMEGDL